MKVSVPNQRLTPRPFRKVHFNPVVRYSRPRGQVNVPKPPVGHLPQTVTRDVDRQSGTTTTDSCIPPMRPVAPAPRPTSQNLQPKVVLTRLPESALVCQFVSRITLDRSCENEITHTNKKLKTSIVHFYKSNLSGTKNICTNEESFYQTTFLKIPI